MSVSGVSQWCSHWITRITWTFYTWHCDYKLLWKTWWLIWGWIPGVGVWGNFFWKSQPRILVETHWSKTIARSWNRDTNTVHRFYFFTTGTGVKREPSVYMWRERASSVRGHQRESHSHGWDGTDTGRYHLHYSEARPASGAAAEPEGGDTSASERSWGEGWNGKGGKSILFFLYIYLGYFLWLNQTEMIWV